MKAFQLGFKETNFGLLLFPKANQHQFSMFLSPRKHLPEQQQALVREIKPEARM